MTVSRSSTLNVKRIGACLYPADADAAARIRKLPVKTTTPIRLARERSHEQNALYWRVLERVVEATGRWRTAEELHMALKVATGFVDSVRLLDGRLVLVPGSIAFDKMSQEDAQRFYDAALKIIADELMGGMAIEELLAA